MIAGGSHHVEVEDEPDVWVRETRSDAEIFNPADGGTFSSTGDLGGRRMGHAATRLQDGLVLLLGGVFIRAQGYGTPLSSAELWNPLTETFTATGSMHYARDDMFLPGAPLLANGMVLVAGAPAVAELYDPVTGTFVLSGELAQYRTAHTATPLSDGRILIAGGVHSDSQGYAVSSASAEIYDPATGAFFPAASMIGP